ncbi:4-hydroxy-tetrahydrodipicolinate synthase [Candidatus Bathyarchaeota archaeon]|nr:4-hydroxy-tetrahydrodipicolinate synthase [Candidatus Bathyarchaeota archaeon]MBS7630819.1 4-hydroxy-tetrahydrodipicolinate synthase [Candidatus Bathyarchaeota archaeon]
MPNVTPFNRAGELELSPLRRLVHNWLDEGVSGFVVNASTGEGALLSREEQITLIELMLEEVDGRAIVIAGTGSIGTRETIELTKNAKECGADAALVVTPYFFKPSDEEIFQHYATLMSSVDLPVILYNVPKFTGYSVKPKVIEKLSSEYDSLIGVKDSSGDVSLIAEIIRLVDDRISVLSGSADTFLPAMTLGGEGAILAIANVVPEICVELYKAFREGDYDKAGELQIKASFINKVLVKEHNQIAAIKAMMNHKKWYAGFPRRPLMPLPKKEEEDLLKTLEDSGILSERG